MITNKPAEKVIAYSSGRQRLGNKTLFTNIIQNQNNVDVRYFSGIDAEIYFEDVFIDETVQIAFNVQQQAMPLYGYNSFVYDDLALGARMISGQFTINFTKASYMYQVLDTLAGMKNNNAISKVKNIDSKAPLWNRTFDIYMSYGDAKQDTRVKNSTILVIKDVSLTSCSQDIDYSGKPVYETYSFVAKDIDFITEGEYIDKTTPVIETILPVIATYFSPRERDDVLFKVDFEKNIQVTQVAYRFSCMNFYEPLFTSDGTLTIEGSYYAPTPKEVGNIVYDYYNKNMGSLRVYVTTSYLDKEGNEKTEEQYLDVIKQDF